MKVKFEEKIKKIENISSKIELIMPNRLIIAFFLIVDGISFLANPQNTIAGMAKNISILMIFASVLSIITNLSSKKKDVKSLIISLIIIIIGIIIIIFPQLVSAYLQIIFALFVIGEGIMNILYTFNLNNISNYTQKITSKLNKITDTKKINKDFDQGIEEQKAKLMNPLKNIVNKSNKNSSLYVFINVIAILLGIYLIVFPDISIVVWGLIFIYTGISDFIIAARTMNLVKKIKEKKFKEILYDEDKQDNSNASEENVNKKVRENYGE